MCQKKKQLIGTIMQFSVIGNHDGKLFQCLIEKGLMHRYLNEGSLNMTGKPVLIFCNDPALVV